VKHTVLAALAGVVLLSGVVAGCVERAKNPENQLPSGMVDLPKPGAVLRPGRTLVGGWAIDDTGVAEVRVFFDGRFKAATTLKVPRPDVSQAKPWYARPGDLHGWNVEVDFGLAPGEHEILVQAVDINGAARDIGLVPVTVTR
jgi:hypothetical protein